MTAAWFTYTRFELLRTFRNRRFFIFSLVFPLVLYFLIAGPNRNDNDFANSGVSAPLYYMVGLASFGTMTAMLSSGARIATEREAGWNRQLRLTPLRPRAYLRAKVLTAYLMACVTIALLYISGASLGVSIPANEWVQMTLLILIGLVPFAAGGILIGHLVTTDSVGPIMGGVTSLLALVSGTWFPLGHSGVLYHIAQYLPSYWIVQASAVSLAGHAWPARAWIVIAAWTVVLVVLALRAYRRDTQRI
jgi:ABC-2 type transport system permease protein